MKLIWNPSTGETIETNANAKLLSVWEDYETRTMRKLAYNIRSQDDYDYIVWELRQDEKGNRGCIGAENAMENLLCLPLLMKGYKERFILNAF
jgi:hypothetical protein